MRLFILLLLALCSVSCSTLPEAIESSPTIVVEGYIEQGQCASVRLSQLLQTSDERVEYSMYEVPIIWAKVTLSCGEESEIMTGRVDNTHMLGFEYCTLHMKGEVGKEYLLTVEYSGRTLTATTTILPPIEFSPLEVEAINDSLCSLRTTIYDPEDEENYYLVMAAEQGQEENRTITILGIWNDVKLAQQDYQVSIYRPFTMLYGEELQPYFHIDSLVEVTVAHVDELTYRFWNTFQDQSINAGNIIYPSEQNPISNIDGGLGIWYGIGGTTQTK